MNLGKIFFLVVLVALFLTGVYVIISLYDQETAYKDFFFSFQDENISNIQFYPNMRYSDRTISYNIDNSCSIKKQKDVKESFNTIADNTILSFNEFPDSAEINILCSNIAPKPEEETHFIAGEGGPSDIINASTYSVILTGKVSLFREEKCDTPKIAIHEILHALGFDHTNDPNSIMYSVTSCDQEVDQFIYDKIDSLYSQDSAPDLVIESTSAEQFGRFLTFEITVSNLGLKKSEGAKLVVYHDSDSVKEFDLNTMGIGVKKVISVENLRLPFGSGRVSFVVETEEDEISKNNNAVELISDQE